MSKFVKLKVTDSVVYINADLVTVVNDVSDYTTKTEVIVGNQQYVFNASFSDIFAQINLANPSVIVVADDTLAVNVNAIAYIEQVYNKMSAIILKIESQHLQNRYVVDSTIEDVYASIERIIGDAV